MKDLKIRKDYWWAWVPYRRVPGQSAWVGFWVDLINPKNRVIPCTFSDNDLKKNPDIKKIVKKTGKEILEGEK